MLVRSLESNPRPPVSAVKRRKHYLKDVQAEFHVSCFMDLFSVISYFTFYALRFWPFLCFMIVIYLRQFCEVNFYIYRQSGGYAFNASKCLVGLKPMGYM